jgi:hypothetical protein
MFFSSASNTGLPPLTAPAFCAVRGVAGDAAPPSDLTGVMGVGSAFWTYTAHASAMHPETAKQHDNASY